MPKSLKILGISAYYHDSAAALTCDGEIVAAAQEERFSRKKHDASFPKQAIQFCLERANLTLDEIDAIVFYDKPLLKFERLLETYYAFAPKGLISFVKAMPVWLKEKLFLKKILFRALQEISHFDKKKIKFLFPEHHLSHAASAFYPSAYRKAAILTIDGVGEWATASICLGEENKITVIKELHFPHSLGLLYSAFTYFLGFRVNSGEYKLMGLAPYGNNSSPEIEKYIKRIKTNLVDIKPDGSIWLNQKYFNYATGLEMIKTPLWEKCFGFPKRKPESTLEQQHYELAFAIQTVTEEIVLKMAKEAQKCTKAEYLCLAGGVALNCVANGKLLKEALFKDIFIQPAAGDAGGALGAALAAHHIYYKQERTTFTLPDKMKMSLLGPEYSNAEIEVTIKKILTSKPEIEATFINKNLEAHIADLIAKGNVIGWMQGRMEFGPRALGARSILADPRNTKMQQILNQKIKYRESFRPFAPLVMEEDCDKYFTPGISSPYMLQVQEVKKKWQEPLPENYEFLPWREKLAVQRSELPAITHVDFSARIQTVGREGHPKLWQLLNEFKKITNCSVLINTSFNVRGEPIVCTPKDAIDCFLNTEMDCLVMGNWVMLKK